MFKARRRSAPQRQVQVHPQISMVAVEVSRLEYEEIRRNIRDLSNDINRNYQWVMAAAAVLLGSQLLGSNWTELQHTLLSHPWILGALAIVTLWFPAYDLSRWSDMKVAQRYMSDVLGPRFAGFVKDESATEVVLWDEFRDNWQVRRGVLLAPVWLVKLLLPYLPSLLSLIAYVRLIEGGAFRWNAAVVLTWTALVLVLVVCMLSTAVRLPRRSRRPVGGSACSCVPSGVGPG